MCLKTKEYVRTTQTKYVQTKWNPKSTETPNCTSFRGKKEAVYSLRRCGYAGSKQVNGARHSSSIYQSRGGPRGDQSDHATKVKIGQK